MTPANPFQDISPAILGDIVGHDHIMDLGIGPLYSPMPRLCGPAFPVYCAPGDNLMMHAAVYRAPVGSVIVVESGDLTHAVAGGHLCHTAQRRNIAGLVVDGVLRDIAKTRANRFPIFARGVVPAAGSKDTIAELGAPIICGGVRVELGDMIVADEEGIVVIEAGLTSSVLDRALELQQLDAKTSIEEWERTNQIRIDKLLAERGFNI